MKHNTKMFIGKKKAKEGGEKRPSYIIIFTTIVFN